MKFEKYFILIFLGVLILFAVALYTIYSGVKEQTIQDLNIGQTIHAQQAAAGIRDYMTNVISTLNFLSRFPEIIELNAQGKRILINYQNLNSDEIKSITRVNARGKIIYTVPLKESIGKDISNQDHIRLSMKMRQIVVSDVFMAVQGFRTVAIHVPVFKNGTYDGTIAFLLSFDKIAQKYIENIRIGTNGYAWVVSEKGIEISSPFPGHIGRNVYDTYKEFPEIISMVGEMLKGKEGITAYHYNRIQDTSDEKILKHAVYLPISFGNTFWSIVIATPEDEVIASLSGFKTNLFLITIALLMICVICMYLIVRFQVITGEQIKREVVLSALQESEAHYRYLFEQNPMPMLIYELGSLIILAVNDAFVAHYGYSKTEASTLHLTDLYPESEKKAIADLIKTLHGHAYVGEWHHLKKDGTLITIEPRSHGFSYEGRAARIAVINDITERKMMEEAVQERERQISLIYDTVGDVIFNLKVEKDGSYSFASVNQCFLSTTGLQANQIIGRRLQDIIPEPSSSLALAKYAEAIREKRIVRWEETSEYPTGQLIGEVSIAPVFDDSNNCVGLVGSVHDITGRKRMEEALRQSEQRYKQLLESITDYTYSVEIQNGRPMKTVHGFGCEKVTGYTPDDYSVIPKLWLQMVHPDDQKVVEHYADPLCEGKEIPALEHRIIHKNGSIIWVRNTYVLKHDANGKVVGYDGLISDITERKQAEEEIRRLNAELEDRVVKRTAQLEAANKELEAFSYSVSHDLRAPLRHASGYVDLLVKKCKSDLSEKGQHYLSSIADSVHQMGVLIDDLLQFSKTGRIEMRQSVSDMNVILGEVMESLRHDNSNRMIKWIIGKLPSVFCDSSMLKLVWVNLLSNAVKFTRTRENARIEIGVQEEEKEFIFYVRDNGVGFDMQYAQKLFGVFQRLHSMDEFEGTGIGLANVRRIISRHEGRTWAKAELDKGATFYFTLPNYKEKKL